MGHVTAHNGAAQRRICDAVLTVYLFDWVCVCASCSAFQSEICVCFAGRQRTASKQATG